MLSRFFIDRPIFAWVIAIIVMLAGVISIVSLLATILVRGNVRRI